MNASLMRQLVSIAFLMLAVLLQAAPKTASDTKGTLERPRELGRIGWLRGFDAASKQAAIEKKPMLVLFQEVPGCHTCTTYGDQVLSHPLVVEAAESLFVPVAVYNNIKGDDERTLKSFQEPAWNNPVVRIVTNDRKGLVGRVSGDYSVAGISNAMVQALVKDGREVPAYLRLLAEETAARKLGVQNATFAMHCFWEGEGALGALKGVVSTMPGFVGKDEVVELEFDPRIIGYQKLLAKARKLECASRVYARNDTQQEVAVRKVGSDAVRSDETVRPDKEPKYYLSKTAYKCVPMTELQAARVNAAIGHKQDPKPFLSPKQIELLGVIESHPTAQWPDMIGATDLVKAWQVVTKLAESM